MSTAYKIPLSGENETFTVSLSGTEYQFTLRWNNAAQGGWMLDIDEPDDGGHIIDGIPLVTGCDLLARYRYKGFVGSLVVYADDSDAAPTEETLGDSCNLYYIPDDDDEDDE